MATIDNFSHKEYQDYFQDIAENHKSIGHTTDVPRFFRENYDEALNAAPAHFSGVFMILIPIKGRIGGEDDAFLQYRTGGFMLVKNVKTDDYNQEATVNDEILQIGFDIISRMLRDYDEQNFIGDFQPDSVIYEQISGDLDNGFGYMFTFDLGAAVNLAYDVSKWND